MKETGAALLADVCANPDADGPRLIYADWLEEHGDQPERAAVIRMSVRRRQLDDLDPESWILDTRISRLTARYQQAWLEELPKLEGVGWEGLHSGLASTVTLSSAQRLSQHAETIFSAAPVTDLECRVQTPREGDTAPTATDTVVACRFLRGLRRLEISGMAPPKSFGVAELARCADLAGVRKLDLISPIHGDVFLEYLADCPPWPSVKQLQVYRGSFSPLAVRTFAGSPLLKSLRWLHLCSCGLRGAGLRELLRSPQLTGLRSLILIGNDIESRVIKNLADYPWERLEQLMLSHNKLTTAGVRHLAGSHRMATVRQLDLANNSHQGTRLGDDAARLLAKSPYLGALVDLDLRGWWLSDRGILALAAAPWWRQIRRLRLTSLHPQESAILAEAEMPALRCLRVTCYGSALSLLLKAHWLPQLTHLSVDVRHSSAQLLAETPGLDNLVSLTLPKTLEVDIAHRLRQRFGDRVEFE